MATLQKIWNEFLNVIFPAVCVGCGSRGRQPICERCFAEIDVNNSFFCPKCSRRLPEAENFCHPEAKFFLAAAASYGNKPVRELIHALKYNRAKTALQPLGEIINQYSKKVFENQSTQADLSARPSPQCVEGSGSKLKIENFTIVPLPLHKHKERNRGFNQAELIAGIMNNELGITVQNNNLVRVKRTESQTKMKDIEEREANVSGAFSLERPEEIAGQNIILVDDVFTSGATMKEAVRVLKQAGARKIIGFVIAKA